MRSWREWRFSAGEIRVDVIAVDARVSIQGHIVSAIEGCGIDKIPQQNTTLILECRDYILGLGSWKNELLHCLSHDESAAHEVTA